VEWLKDNSALLWWVGIGSAALFLLTLIAIPIYIIRMPDDALVRARDQDRHGRLGLVAKVLKNIAAAFLILAGIAMLALPGQGLLTLVVGLMLIDFPGKQRLQDRFLCHKRVLKSMNWLRQRAHRPPLDTPDCGHQEARRAA
jgi:hypothetical protein